MPIGQTSNPITLTFNVDGGAFNAGIGSTVALTLGAPNLDFAIVVGTDTCSNQTIAAGGSCSIQVTFTPKYPGARNGAVTLAYSGPLAATATAYVYGTGTGPQAVFNGAAPTTLASGFKTPIGVAVDGAGNVYVGEYDNNDVKEIAAGTGAVTSLGSGFGAPAGVAVDGAGNIYVAYIFNNAVYEIAAGTGTVTTLGSGFNSPEGVAVDGAGNVYVADSGNSAVKVIAASTGIVTQLASGFISVPLSVAVDGAGNVYVGEYGNNDVKEIAAGGTVTTLASGFNNPSGVAVDAAGNVYVTDTNHNAVKVIAAGTGTVTTLASGFNTPQGVAVDGAGNVYVADSGNDAVKEIPRATPPSLTFAATNVGAISADSTVAIQNIGNLALTLPPLPAGFAINATDNTCPATLAAGAACLLAIDFAPGSSQSGNISANYRLDPITLPIALFGPIALNGTLPTATVPLDARWMLILLGTLLVAGGARATRKARR